MWIKANGDGIEDDVLRQSIANKNYLLYVGTDSHSYGSFWLFATVICCYRPGNGGKFFTKRVKIPKNEIKTLVDRLLREAYLSIEAAQEVENLCDRRPEIHVDVASRNTLSSKFYTNVISYVKGMGYEVASKPNAWASSCIADRQAR